MRWKQATLAQLYEILFNDKNCPTQLKLEALHEYQRRQQWRPRIEVQAKIQRRKW